MKWLFFLKVPYRVVLCSAASILEVGIWWGCRKEKTTLKVKVLEAKLNWATFSKSSSHILISISFGHMTLFMVPVLYQCEQHPFGSSIVQTVMYCFYKKCCDVINSQYFTKATRTFIVFKLCMSQYFYSWFLDLL